MSRYWHRQLPLCHFCFICHDAAFLSFTAKIFEDSVCLYCFICSYSGTCVINSFHYVNKPTDILPPTSLLIENWNVYMCWVKIPWFQERMYQLHLQLWAYPHEITGPFFWKFTWFSLRRRHAWEKVWHLPLYFFPPVTNATIVVVP